jgi:dTDP-L-rhamnose 4-epimerase
VSVLEALVGIDAVYHLAAAVGVGQSMYEIIKYTAINNVGIATLLQALTCQPVERVVVASSMSIYGEGLYRSPNGENVRGVSRSVTQLMAGEWELFDEKGQQLCPIPTPESKEPALASVYALSTFDQEQMS